MKARRKSLGVMGDAALRYAALGLPILPLEPESKKPAAVTVNGIYAATTNADQNVAMWTENPAYNVGVATGACDLCVLDIDGFLGEQTLAALEAKYGRLPDTVTQSTPGKYVDGLHSGKGRHLFFKGMRDLQSMEEVAPGIDVRASGGLIVLAPSRHPHGGIYEFLPKRSFTDLSPAVLPAHWVEFLQAACNKVRSTADHSGGVEAEQLREERELRRVAEAKAREALELLVDTQNRFIAHLAGKLPPHPFQKEAAEF